MIEMKPLDVLSSKIESRQARVAVVGLGYVGLPVLRAFFDAGFHVVGFDINAQKIELHQQGGNDLVHLGDQFVADMHAQDRNRITWTSDPDDLATADAMLICVPTPLGDELTPDLSYVENTARMIAKTLEPGRLIVLESTTYPGTTRDVLRPIFESTGLRVGQDIALAFAPERVDPGRTDVGVTDVPRLVGGLDAVSTDLAKSLYSKAFSHVIEVTRSEVAEAAKLLENIYRAVNIAMVNEMKQVFDAMDLDIWEVLDAAQTKPYGFHRFDPGPGLGGHCLPIDPFYLSWKAKAVGQPSDFIELAGRINRSMPSQVVKRLIDALEQRHQTIESAKVLIIGLAYKPNVGDTRESPALELIHQLKKRNATVSYHDPHVPRMPKTRRFGEIEMASQPVDETMLASYDAVVIATHHDSVDWEMVAKRSRLIVDTRGIMRQYLDPDDPRWVRA